MLDAKLEFLLHLISVSGSALTVIKLFTTGLHKRYPFFFCYCIFRIPNFTWPLLIPDPRSLSYRHVWSVTEPMAWAFHILVVFELYRLILKDHRGLYTVGKWAMYAATAISVMFFLLTLIPNLRPGMPPFAKVMNYELAIGRGTELSLLIFIILMLLFLSRYPIKLNRNLVVHVSLYSLFFLSMTLDLVLAVVFDMRLSPKVALIADAVSAACSVAWFLLLSTKGEQAPGRFVRFTPLHEQRALKQLEALNATLLKISQK